MSNPGTRKKKTIMSSLISKKRKRKKQYNPCNNSSTPVCSKHLLAQMVGLSYG